MMRRTSAQTRIWNDGEWREQKNHGKQETARETEVTGTERERKAVSALLLQRFIALLINHGGLMKLFLPREPHGSHVQSWHKSCWQGIEVDYIVQINCCLNLPLFLPACGGLGTWAVYCLVLIAAFFFFLLCAGTSPRFLPTQRDHVKNFNLKGLRISLGERFLDVSDPNSRSKMDKSSAGNLHWIPMST